MLEFICPTCGHFSLDDEVCTSHDSAVSEDLVA